MAITYIPASVQVPNASAAGQGIMNAIMLYNMFKPGGTEDQRRQQVANQKALNEAEVANLGATSEQTRSRTNALNQEANRSQTLFEQEQNARNNAIPVTSFFPKLPSPQAITSGGEEGIKSIKNDGGFLSNPSAVKGFDNKESTPHVAPMPQANVNQSSTLANNPTTTQNAPKALNVPQVSDFMQALPNPVPSQNNEPVSSNSEPKISGGIFDTQLPSPYKSDIYQPSVSGATANAPINTSDKQYADSSIQSILNPAAFKKPVNAISMNGTNLGYLNELEIPTKPIANASISVGKESPQSASGVTTSDVSKNVDQGNVPARQDTNETGTPLPSQKTSSSAPAVVQPEAKSNIASTPAQQQEEQITQTSIATPKQAESYEPTNLVQRVREANPEAFDAYWNAQIKAGKKPNEIMDEVTKSASASMYAPGQQPLDLGTAQRLSMFGFQPKDYVDSKTGAVDPYKVGSLMALGQGQGMSSMSGSIRDPNSGIPIAVRNAVMKPDGTLEFQTTNIPEPLQLNPRYQQFNVTNGEAALLTPYRSDNEKALDNFGKIKQFYTNGKALRSEYDKNFNGGSSTSDYETMVAVAGISNPGMGVRESVMEFLSKNQGILGRVQVSMDKLGNPVGAVLSPGQRKEMFHIMDKYYDGAKTNLDSLQESRVQQAYQALNGKIPIQKLRSDLKFNPSESSSSGSSGINSSHVGQVVTGSDGLRYTIVQKQDGSFARVPVNQ